MVADQAKQWRNLRAARFVDLVGSGRRMRGPRTSRTALRRTGAPSISLKAEVTRGVAFATEAALRRELERYVRYYNTTRQHSALGYYSPIAFERLVL
jgi:transposase InsO family protein